MMKPRSQELDTFNATMDAILRADPKAVKEEMEREKRANETERRAKGEKKRGRHSDKHDA